MGLELDCPVVGLVGGVGSGKSAVAQRAAELFHFAVIDGDAAGHRALESPAVREQLRARFGDLIFKSGGSVDRSALAARVFGTSTDQLAAKFDLEAISHPVIRAAVNRQIDEARQARTRAVLLDAAVLLEAGWEDCCDLIALIDTSVAQREHQATVLRGWSVEQWQKREASQFSLDQKRERATIIVANNGSLGEAARRLGAEIEHWKLRRNEAESIK